MEKVRPRRHLAAILAADVADYSRLMGADEEGTHAELMAHLRALGNPKIDEHGGRIIKKTGDGFLAEFPSVVEAVNCAVEIQQGMAERNADVPQEKRLEFRMGINRQGLRPTTIAEYSKEFSTRIAEKSPRPNAKQVSEGMSPQTELHREVSNPVWWDPTR